MKTFKFKSKSSSKTYTTIVQSDGQASCDCRGWIYSGVNRHCTHTDQVLGIVSKKTPRGDKAKKAKKTSQKVSKSVEAALKGLKVPKLGLPYFSPMLAQEGKPALIEERFDDDDWIAEEKFDGARYLMYIGKDGNRFFSRRISVKDGLPVEKSANIPHLSEYDLSQFEGTVLDGEIMPASGVFTDVPRIMGSLPEKAIERQETLGKVGYRIFDILYYKGTKVMNDEMSARHQIVSNIPFCHEHMTITKQTYGASAKRKLLSDIYAAGGEGIILKNVKGKYVPGGRDKDVWMKVKRKRDYDVVVTGFEDPKQYSVNVNGDTVENKHWLKKQIATIKFGVYKDGVLVDVGKCSGLNDEIREELSRNKSKYIGKVMVVEGQEFLKEGIRFPHYIRFREDKDPKDCKYEDLK